MGPSQSACQCEPVFCLVCSQIAAGEYLKQKKDNVPDEEILVTPPSLVYTWRIVTVNNMPVSAPTCLAHLNYAEKSSLAIT